MTKRREEGPSSPVKVSQGSLGSVSVDLAAGEEAGPELAGPKAQLRQLHEGTEDMRVALTQSGPMLPAMQGLQAQVYCGGHPPECKEASETCSS